MNRHNELSSLRATNGLSPGYAHRHQKRKRPSLRVAIFVLLVAIAGALYVNQLDEPPARTTQISPSDGIDLYLTDEEPVDLYLTDEKLVDLYLDYKNTPH